MSTAQIDAPNVNLPTYRRVLCRLNKLRGLTSIGNQSMDVRLTNGEVSLLRELQAARESGRTLSASASAQGIDRLVTEGYVLERAIGVDTVLYSITAAGRSALGCHQARIQGDPGSSAPASA